MNPLQPKPAWPVNALVSEFAFRKVVGVQRMKKARQ